MLVRILTELRSCDAGLQQSTKASLAMLDSAEPKEAELTSFLEHQRRLAHSKCMLIKELAALDARKIKNNVQEEAKENEAHHHVDDGRLSDYSLRAALELFKYLSAEEVLSDVELEKAKLNLMTIICREFYRRRVESNAGWVAKRFIWLVAMMGWPFYAAGDGFNGAYMILHALRAPEPISMVIEGVMALTNIAVVRQFDAPAVTRGLGIESKKAGEISEIAEKQALLLHAFYDKLAKLPANAKGIDIQLEAFAVFHNDLVKKKIVYDRVAGDLKKDKRVRRAKTALSVLAAPIYFSGGCFAATWFINLIKTYLHYGHVILKAVASIHILHVILAAILTALSSGTLVAVIGILAGLAMMLRYINVERKELVKLVDRYYAGKLPRSAEIADECLAKAALIDQRQSQKNDIEKILNNHQKIIVIELPNAKNSHIEKLKEEFQVKLQQYDQYRSVIQSVNINDAKTLIIHNQARYQRLLQQIKIISELQAEIINLQAQINSAAAALKAEKETVAFGERPPSQQAQPSDDKCAAAARVASSETVPAEQGAAAQSAIANNSNILWSQPWRQSDDHNPLATPVFGY